MQLFRGMSHRRPGNIRQNAGETFLTPMPPNEAVEERVRQGTELWWYRRWPCPQPSAVKQLGPPWKSAPFS